MLCEQSIVLFDKTPDHNTEEIRKNRTFSFVKAKEIKAWLCCHKDIESYIILDDLDLKDEDLRPRTILINNTVGLCEQDIENASQIFAQKLD